MKHHYPDRTLSPALSYFLIILITLTLSASMFPTFLAYAQINDEEINTILTQAESLFKAIKENNYIETWRLLTGKSRKSIVEDVHKHIKKGGGSISEEVISADFASGGELAQAYWKGYITSFDPDLILTQSSWQPGKIKKDSAEIIIQYKKAENPAILLMFREEGIWKVGLEETFGTRKWLP